MYSSYLGPNSVIRKGIEKYILKQGIPIANNTFTLSLRGETVTFSLDAIAMIIDTDKDVTSYTIGNRDYAIGFFEENGEVKISRLTKVDNPTPAIVETNFYSLQGDHVGGLRINTIDEHIEPISPEFSHNSRISCDDVTACINEVYNELGWYSVGMWVGTFVWPELGVSVVIGCIIRQCH